jgi:hypothetical protein
LFRQLETIISEVDLGCTQFAVNHERIHFAQRKNPAEKNSTQFSKLSFEEIFIAQTKYAS